MTHSSRRTFLRATIAGAGAAFATPLEALLARVESGRAPDDALDFGPLGPVKDEATGLPLLQLPEGFRYVSFGWTGDPLDDGGQTPGAHDGMAAFAQSGPRVTLVRNHEITGTRSFAASLTYDPGAGGGTTTLEFDSAAGRWLTARASLGGTCRNCAGGPTPWGSWLTCEETLLGPGERSITRHHGYVFEVPAHGTSSCEPLVDMGRFVHEAVAVDPVTGIVYETEDQRASGLYRFIPKSPGELAAGGRLEMLAIAGRQRFDTRTRQPRRARYGLRWVPIDQPNPIRGASVFAQGYSRGGAIFGRLEGACYDAGKIYVTSTSGGNAAMGQVWEVDPAGNELRLLFESPGARVLNMPDNLCASPRGGLVICEDGTTNPSVHGLTKDGRIFRFARNNVVLRGEVRGLKGDFRQSEFAGATFSPDGQWLFLNVQNPGVTVAITGPWRDGFI